MYYLCIYRWSFSELHAWSWPCLQLMNIQTKRELVSAKFCKYHQCNLVALPIVGFLSRNFHNTLFQGISLIKIIQQRVSWVSKCFQKKQLFKLLSNVQSEEIQWNVQMWSSFANANTNSIWLCQHGYGLNLKVGVEQRTQRGSNQTGHFVLAKICTLIADCIKVSC